MNLQDTKQTNSQRKGGDDRTSGGNLLLVNGTKEFQSRFEFSFWVVGLDDGGNHCDVNILGADVVS